MSEYTRVKRSTNNEVQQRRDLGLKSGPKDWRSGGSILQSVDWRVFHYTTAAPDSANTQTVFLVYTCHKVLFHGTTIKTQNLMKLKLQQSPITNYCQLLISQSQNSSQTTDKFFLVRENLLYDSSLRYQKM